jgi:hypothetical protein
MTNVRSNINLLRKTNGGGGNHKTTNIFKNYIKNQNNINQNNIIGKRNILLSLLSKNYKNKTNELVFNIKKNKTKEIFANSGIESFNIEDGSKKNQHHGNINLRLNLNNEIINNNFNNCYSSIKQKKMHKSLSNITINEKLKEKDKYIIQLQKELLKSQEFLNRLQKDKQNELSMEYHTIQKIDSLDKYKSSSSLTSLLNKQKKNNNKKRGSINKKRNNAYNTGFYSNNNNIKSKYNSSPKSNYLRYFSSSHRFLCYNLDNFETYNSNYLTRNSLYKKSQKSIKYNKNSNSNSNKYVKKNDKLSLSDELYFTGQVSNSNYDTINIKYQNENISEFIEKYQILKKRAKLLLNNYISLIKELNVKSKK